MLLSAAAAVATQSANVKGISRRDGIVGGDVYLAVVGRES